MARGILLWIKGGFAVFSGEFLDYLGILLLRGLKGSDNLVRLFD